MTATAAEEQVWQRAGASIGRQQALSCNKGTH